MSFVANFPGVCRPCGGPILPGQTIKRNKARRYEHDDCDSAVGDGFVNEHKARTGRCEDAPCCGCCGGWQEAETAYLVY